MRRFIQTEVEIDRAYFWQFSSKRKSGIDGVVIFWVSDHPVTFFIHAN